MRRALHFLAVFLAVLSIPLAFGVLNSALRADRTDCLAGDARACSRVIDAGGMQGHDLAKAFFIRGLQAIADFETTLEVDPKGATAKSVLPAAKASRTCALTTSALRSQFSGLMTMLVRD